MTAGRVDVVRAATVAGDRAAVASTGQAGLAIAPAVERSRAARAVIASADLAATARAGPDRPGDRRTGSDRGGFQRAGGDRQDRYGSRAGGERYGEFRP